MRIRFGFGIFNLITTTREKKRYEELQNNAEERERSTRYGKKFIACGIGALILGVIGLLCAVGAKLLGEAMRDTSLAVGFQAVLYVLCIGLAAILLLYSLIFYFSRLKYIRWQKSLNDLPIAKKARIFSIVAFVLLVAIAVVTVWLIIASFS